MLARGASIAGSGTGHRGPMPTGVQIRGRAVTGIDLRLGPCLAVAEVVRGLAVHGIAVIPVMQYAGLTGVVLEVRMVHVQPGVHDAHHHAGTVVGPGKRRLP